MCFRFLPRLGPTGGSKVASGTEVRTVPPGSSEMLLAVKCLFWKRCKDTYVCTCLRCGTDY